MKWSHSLLLVPALLLPACDGDVPSAPVDGGPAPRVDGDVGPIASDAAVTPDMNGPSESAVDAGPAPLEGSYDEVFQQGIARYTESPVTVETDVVTAWPTASRPIQVHHFSSENRGPVCMYGDDFFVETREGPSDTLMIFLQGGGVCLTEICAATPSPLLSLQLFTVASLAGIGGLLDVRDEDNPARDFDVVNAPYCDGSLFAGDVDRILSDGNRLNGQNDLAYQRGLQNLTATLRTAKQYHPDPPRIVLAGSSGGAYGVLAGVVMTRYFYPDTPLLVLSDSGAPIVNGDDTDFIHRALTEFDALDLIPASCPGCVANGHATGILAWALRRDPNLSFAYMTHARDHVIGEFFMGMTADQFEAAVVAETSRLMHEFPGRVFRFVIPSARHTLTMGIDGVSDGLQGGFLGLAGSLGVGFVGDDVSSAELATWALGGLTETGVGSDGHTWTGYDWLRSLFTNPSATPSVLQLD